MRVGRGEGRQAKRKPASTMQRHCPRAEEGERRPTGAVAQRFGVAPPGDSSPGDGNPRRLRMSATTARARGRGSSPTLEQGCTVTAADARVVIVPTHLPRLPEGGAAVADGLGGVEARARTTHGSASTTFGCARRGLSAAVARAAAETRSSILAATGTASGEGHGSARSLEEQRGLSAEQGAELVGGVLGARRDREELLAAARPQPCALVKPPKEQWVLPHRQRQPIQIAKHLDQIGWRHTKGAGTSGAGGGGGSSALRLAAAAAARPSGRSATGSSRCPAAQRGARAAGATAAPPSPRSPKARAGRGGRSRCAAAHCERWHHARWRSSERSCSRACARTTRSCASASVSAAERCTSIGGGFGWRGTPTASCRHEPAKARRTTRRCSAAAIGEGERLQGVGRG